MIIPIYKDKKCIGFGEKENNCTNLITNHSSSFFYCNSCFNNRNIYIHKKIYEEGIILPYDNSPEKI